MSQASKWLTEFEDAIGDALTTNHVPWKSVTAGLKTGAGDKLSDKDVQGVVVAGVPTDPPQLREIAREVIRRRVRVRVDFTR